MSVNHVNSVSYQSLLDQYFEVFSNELGTLRSTQAHLEVQPNSTPNSYLETACMHACMN